MVIVGRAEMVFEMCSIAETVKSVVVVLSNERTRDWIARLVEGVYIGRLASSKGVYRRKEKTTGDTQTSREKGGKKRESGVPNLLETFNLNLPWHPILIDHSRLLVDGRRAFQMVVPAAQGLSLAVRE